MAGWYVSNPGYSCMIVGGFTGYRCKDVAITTNSSAESLTLKGIKLADNGQGTSLSVTNPDDDLRATITITESLYIGQSLHVHCTDCASTECAATYGAVLGTFMLGPG